LNGSVKTNQWKFINLAFFKPAGQFSLIGTKHGHDDGAS
jgi:hypothetical protein